MAEIAEMPRRREFFLDEAGVGKRVTWHEDRQLFVLSLWRDDVCVEAMRLDPDDAARLASMVTTSLASAVPRSASRTA